MSIKPDTLRGLATELDVAAWTRANAPNVIAALITAKRKDLAESLCAALGTTMTQWRDAAWQELWKRGMVGPDGVTEEIKRRARPAGNKR